MNVTTTLITVTSRFCSIPQTCRGTLGDGNTTCTNLPPYTMPEMSVIASFAGILSMITVLGNSMVMISFKIDKQLQTISNYFLFSLAVADLAVGLISMPLFTISTLMGYWPLGRHICDTWLALDYLASNASVLNLLIISFDRYFSVTRPLTYRAKRTTARAAIMIAGAWGISLLLWPPWIYAWPYIEGRRTVPENECYIQFIETNHYITFGTAIAAFYLPVTVMIVLYYRIWKETKKRQKELPNLQGGGPLRPARRSNSSDELDLTDEVRRYRFGSRFARKPTSPSVAKARNSWFRRWCVDWWHNTRQNPRFTIDLEESMGSELAYITPTSVDTPLPSSISMTTSFNIVDERRSQPNQLPILVRPELHYSSQGTQTPPESPAQPERPPMPQPEEQKVRKLYTTINIEDDSDDDSSDSDESEDEGELEEVVVENQPPKEPQPITPRSTGPEVYKAIPDGGLYTIMINFPEDPKQSEKGVIEATSIKLYHNEEGQATRAAEAARAAKAAAEAEAAAAAAAAEAEAAAKAAARAAAPKPVMKDASTSTTDDQNSIQPAPIERRPSILPTRLARTLLRPKKKSTEKKQDKKAARTLTAILLSFIITWTPYNVLVLLKPLTSEYTCIPQQLWDFFYYLCYINSTINPVCYALCNASFRRTYVRILTCRWKSRERVGLNRGVFNT